MLDKLPRDQWTPAAAAHLLNRAGFGGSPSDVDRLHALGLEGAVEQMLQRPPEVRLPEADLTTLRPEGEMMNRAAMERELTPEERQKIIQQRQRQERGQIAGLQNWWLQEMYRTGDRALEKMTLFWHGHFATSLQKVNQAALMWRQNETLREHALGDFRSMLRAISRDPAMIIWLDLRRSAPPVPNENFARELMELFTLGEGHYTEKDIREAARAFTGYRIDRNNGLFEYDMNANDMGKKTFFGKTDHFSGDDIIDIILEQEQCARFLCGKIWRFFVSETPNAEAIDALATVWRRADYRMPDLLRTLFSSKIFHAPNHVGRQIKSPVQWIVQSCRAFELGAVPSSTAIRVMRDLGQVLFLPPNVKGWDGGKTWITTSTLLQRYNDAPTLVGLGGSAREGEGRARRFMEQFGVTPVNAQVDLASLFPQKLRKDLRALITAVCDRAFNGPPSPEEKASFENYVAAHSALTDADLIGLLRLVFATPRFQLC